MLVMVTLLALLINKLGNNFNLLLPPAKLESTSLELV